METLTTHQQVLNVQSNFSIRPAVGVSAITFMIKPFCHGDDWFGALLVHDQDTNELMGNVSKFTRHNLILEHPKSCRPGNHFRFRLKLPSHVLGHTQVLFEAICCDSQKHSEETYLNTFSSPVADPGSIDVLEMLIMKFAIRSLN